MRAGDSEDGEEIVSRYLEDRLRRALRAIGWGALRVNLHISGQWEELEQVFGKMKNLVLAVLTL